MNKTPRLSKSGIEYLDRSWGIWSGCQNLERGICPVNACWAKSIANRFPNHYPNGFEPTFYPESIESPLHIKKPSRIGVGWVGDVIGYGGEYGKDQIYETIRQCPQHTFLFLTKNPQNLAKWSPFPDNCWVGVSATNDFQQIEALAWLQRIEAKVKYLSIEPLLEEIILPSSGLERILNWLIIGQQTPIHPETTPKLEWIKEIVEAAEKAGVKVFLKNNLRPLLEPSWLGNRDNSWAFRHGELRQGMPKEER